MGKHHNCNKTCCFVYLHSPILAASCCREVLEKPKQQICNMIRNKAELDCCKCIKRKQTKNKKLLNRLQQTNTFVEDTATDWYKSQLKQFAYASARLSNENDKMNKNKFLPNIQLKACKTCNCPQYLTKRLNAGVEMSRNLALTEDNKKNPYTDFSFPLKVNHNRNLCSKTSKSLVKVEFNNIESKMKSNSSECPKIARLKAGAERYSPYEVRLCPQKNSCNLQTKCANFSKGYKRMSPEFANVLHSYESQRLRSVPKGVQKRLSEQSDRSPNKLKLRYPPKKKSPAACCEKLKPSNSNLTSTHNKMRVKTYKPVEAPPKKSFLQKSKEAIKHFLRRRDCDSKGECFTSKFAKIRRQQEFEREQADRRLYCSCPNPDETNPTSGCQCSSKYASPENEQETSTDAAVQQTKRVSIKENANEQRNSGPVPQYLEGYSEEDRPCANCPNVKTYTVTIPAGASILEQNAPKSNRKRKGKKGKRVSIDETVQEFEDEPEIRKFIFPLPAAPPPPPPMCPYPYANNDSQGNDSQGKVVGGCACNKKPEPEAIEENLACCCDLLSPFAREIKKEEQKRIDQAVERPNEKFECNTGDPHYMPRASAFAHCFNFRRDEKELMKSSEGRLELLKLKRKECEERQRLAREKKKNMEEECKECDDAQELIVELQIPKPKKVVKSSAKQKSKAKQKKPEPKPKCQKLKIG